MDEVDKRIILAGDIGGTNSRLALYEAAGKRAAPSPIFERSYPSRSYRALSDIADEFLSTAEVALGARVGRGRGVDAACLAVAGPIENNILRATNLPWTIDGRMLAAHLGIDRVTLVNDFFAAALGAVAVGPEWLAPLGGTPGVRHGPIAVLGAGTGLGVAFLLWSNGTDSYQVVPSEAGHVDFAPRTPLEAGLLQYLIHKYGRVSCERVLCGRGLVDVFTFLSQEPACRALIRAETTAALAGVGHSPDPAAVISGLAMAGSDPICEMSLALFCSVLGAVAGNLALSILATGGVYVAGGIAPRLIPYLANGVFREAFDTKGRLHTMVERFPAFVVTHPQVGLVGAASAAAAITT
ncbi:MAG TPA: glucokinase [Polyangia bacterium]|nr:glucokinase [Polyangia bacterium]